MRTGELHIIRGFCGDTGVFRIGEPLREHDGWFHVVQVERPDLDPMPRIARHSPNWADSSAIEWTDQPVPPVSRASTALGVNGIDGTMSNDHRDNISMDRPGEMP